MSENTEWAIENRQKEKLATKDTPDEEKQNTIYVGHHYMQVNTNIKT